MSLSRSLPALTTAAVLVLAGIAAASAQDRCEGTLCDLYYNNIRPSQPQAPQTAPGQQGRQGQPSQQSQSAPPAAGRPLIGVQGDGVVGLLQGRAPQRCTGTLCDLYYGGPPKEEPAAAQPAAAAPASPAAEAEIDEPAAAAPATTSRGVEPREAERRCAASARDPWSCYR